MDIVIVANWNQTENREDITLFNIFVLYKNA